MEDSPKQREVPSKFLSRVKEICEQNDFEPVVEGAPVIAAAARLAIPAAKKIGKSMAKKAAATLGQKALDKATQVAADVQNNPDSTPAQKKIAQQLPTFLKNKEKEENELAKQITQANANQTQM